MDEQTARKWLERFMLIIQRARSIAREQAEKLACERVSPQALESALEMLNPWLFGKRCPFDAVTKLLEKEELRPFDFYNMMTIASFIPETGILSQIMYNEDLPEPDVAWLMGWRPA